MGVELKHFFLGGGGGGGRGGGGGGGNDLGEKYGTKFGVLIFRLIITYFGTLKMHQIAPFLSNLGVGGWGGGGGACHYQKCESLSLTG